MTHVKLKSGRSVEVTEIHYGSEVEDTYIVAAYYSDVEGTGEDAECTEAEIEELNETYAGELASAWAEHQVGYGEWLSDMERDR